MAREFPIRMIDFLLHNRHELRREVELLTAQQSGSIPKIPPRGATERRSPVEREAISRAEFTVVLDAIDRAWDSLSPDLRRIARAKYGRAKMSNKEIETRYHLSRSTVYRKLETIRAVVAGRLALIPEAIMRRFWYLIETFWDDLLRRT